MLESFPDLLFQYLFLALRRVFRFSNKPEACHFFRVLASNVRGHDDDGIFEVHLPALRVGEVPTVQNLKQEIECIGMCLLNLIKQDNRVWAVLDHFRERPALFVSDISWRRADKLRDGVPFHIFGHIKADERLVVVKHELRKRPRELRLSHSRRTQEDERADWSVFFVDARSRAPDRI